MPPLTLRDEALLMLQGGGAILQTAREVSKVLADAGIDGAVIGGVAVVLHGHVRTTADVDVFTPAPLERVADVLRNHGFTFDADASEFRKGQVPVQLVRPDDVGISPGRRVDLEEIRTVPLEELISMKLESGTNNLLRAQDLADVIGMIRANHLTGAFTPKVHKSVRAEFRKLVRAVARGG